MREATANQLEELIERKRRKFVGITRHWGASVADGEDIVQSACLRVLKARSKTRGGAIASISWLERYLERAVRTECIDRFRQRKRRPEELWDERLAFPAFSPEDAAIEEDLKAAVMELLPPREFRILQAHCEGGSWDEIAAAEAISKRQASRLLRDAIKKIRNLGPFTRPF